MASCCFSSWCLAGSSLSAATPEEASATPRLTELTTQDLLEAKQYLPPPTLRTAPGPFRAEFRGSARSVIEQAARLLQIDLLIDADYLPSAAPLRIPIHAADHRELIQFVSTATGTMWIPLSEDRVLIAKDTMQKRQELEPTVAVVLSVPDPITTQEFQELARAVQQTMDLQKFALDNNRRMVLMRDKVSKVRPAQQLFQQLAGAKPSVVLEVELYELRQNRTLDAGAKLPTSFNIFSFSRLWNNQPPQPSSFANIVRIGAGESLLGVTIGNGEVTAAALKTAGRNVQQTTVRSLHGLPANVNFGERYPIVTGTFAGAGTNSQFTPAPSINFENLGLNLKITPYVHGTDEMSIELEVEYKVRTGATLNGLPVLANRSLKSVMRLRQEEWALVGGLRNTSRSLTQSGVPWPFRQNSLQEDDVETLVVIRPILLALPATESPTPIFRVGSESRPPIPL